MFLCIRTASSGRLRLKISRRAEIPDTGSVSGSVEFLRRALSWTLLDDSRMLRYVTVSRQLPSDWVTGPQHTCPSTILSRVAQKLGSVAADIPFGNSSA